MELFKHGPSLGYRWFLLTLLVIFIMVLDHRDHHTQWVRQVLSAVVAPIQYTVHWPIEMADRISTQLSSHENLLTENQELQSNQLLLEAKVQKLEALEKENDRLRALLQASPRGVEHVEVAELLAIDSNPYVQEFTLAKGTHDKVFVGQPVLDADGVIGQIIRVGSMTSQVLLLTDSRSSIPVEDGRSGIRGIVSGTGSPNTLSLVYIAKTADIQVGDLLITSGLGQRFPAGLPVGKIVDIQNLPGEHFASVDVEPMAQFNRSQLVLLVWPDEKQSLKR